MTTASLYVVMGDTAFYYDLRPQIQVCEDAARKADPNMSGREATDRCFAAHAIAKWQRDGSLLDVIASSRKLIRLEGKLYDPRFVFGLMYAQNGKTAIVCKENELLGVNVDGEPLGRGFNVDVGNKYASEQTIRTYLNPLMSFIRKYSKAAKIRSFEIGTTTGHESAHRQA